MDPVGTLWIVSAWLRDQITSQVGRFASWRSIDVYRCDFDAAALSDASYVSVGMLCMLDGSNDPVAAFRQDVGWPCDVCML